MGWKVWVGLHRRSFCQICFLQALRWHSSKELEPSATASTRITQKRTGPGSRMGFRVEEETGVLTELLWASRRELSVGTLQGVESERGSGTILFRDGVDMAPAC